MTSQRRRTVRLVLASALVATLGGAIAAPPPRVRGDGRAGLAAALAARGLSTRAADVAFLSPPNTGISGRHAFALGRRGTEPRDLYLVEARIAPGGRVLALGDVTNVSRSIGADESNLVVRAPWAAYATTTEGGVVAVTLLDTRGEDPSLTRGWSAGWQLANRVTNYQDTGLASGLRRRRYNLAQPSAKGVALVLGARGRLSAVLGGGERLTMEPGRDVPVEGAGLARLYREVKAQPGLIGWAVDTARAVSWVGPERIEWLEHTAFGFLDAGKQAYYGVAPTETGAELAHELGVDDVGGASLTSAPYPELGWPPENLRPLRHGDRAEGEGVWVPVAEGPFTAQNPGAPPAFYTTFFRPDVDRSYTKAFLTVWDPRQVELDVRAGTREPEDETGVAGDGQISREPSTLLRLAGGFNGGFQAMHGEYGMMMDGRVLLPPKPWAATVARLRGGRIAFGTWPSTHPEGGQGVGVPLPPDVESFRQNMTVLVQDGVVNPYRRPWWGTAPEGSAEPAYTVRTGLCLTREKHVVYFWGLSLSHLALAEAMRAARCSYGLHLDMNSGHSGFEYYHVSRAGTEEPLAHPLERNQEAEGPVPGAPGLFFRARRMVRGMGHMNFPRYIQRDPRDFMYLLLKPILPGPNLPALAPPRPGEGEWIVKGLPQKGFPWAFARTFVRPDAATPDVQVRLARIDPRRVRLDPPPGADALGALVPPAPPDARQPFGLTLADGRFAIGAPGATSIATGVPIEGAPDACRAGVGVDADGFLIWAEGAPPGSLGRALSIAGAIQTMVLCGPDPRFEFHFGAGRVGRLDEGPVRPTPAHAVRLYGADEAAAERLFPEVPIVPPSIWFGQQKVRIRYFHELQPLNPAGTPRPLSAHSE